MIMNKMGGGSGSEGTSYRMVGLSEVFFDCNYYLYQTEGYRAFTLSNNGYFTFQFPGKVVKIISFKYIYKTSSSGAWGSEQTFTGDWYISGQKATPVLTFSKNYYYRPTELIAIIEDSVSNGTTAVMSVNTNELKSNSARGILRKTLGGNNIISFTGIPANYMPMFRSIDITGNLLDINAAYYNYLPDNVTLSITLKLGENQNQGFTHREGILYLSSTANYLTFYTGFDPNYVVVSKFGQTSSASTVGVGMCASSWVRNGLPSDAAYNSNILNNYNASALFSAIGVTYTASLGYIQVSDAQTYPDGFSQGYYHIIAMK